MGDVLSRPSPTHPMWTVVHPPPGVLEETLGGVALPYEERYASLRSRPYQCTEERAAVLWSGERFVTDAGAVIRDIAAAHPDIAEEGADTPMGVAIVYHRLRLHRRSTLRYMLRLSLSLYGEATAEDDCLLFAVVEEYNRLVTRVGRDARDPSLLNIATALRDRIAAVASPGAEPMRDRILFLLRELTGNVQEDIRVFRLYRRRSRANPGAPPPPPPATQSTVPNPPPPPRPTPTTVHTTQYRAPNRSPSRQRNRRRTPAGKRPGATAIPLPPRSPLVVPTPLGHADRPTGESATPTPCVVCQDATRRPRLPCGHKVMCSSCTASVQRCPLCRDNYLYVEVAWEDPDPREYVVATKKIG